MPTALFGLLVLAGAAVYFMTPAERARWGRSALAAATHLFRAAREGPSLDDPFEAFLRARTGRPIVTPLLLAANALVFMLMLFDRSGLDPTQTLIAWGANFAPRTTNGEWWRLVAATFVHGGLFHLAATLIGLLPLGLILERAVGRIAFATVYVAAGIVASVVSLWTMSPTAVTFGASGSIFGVYGLLLASVLCAVVNRAAVSVPLSLVKRIAIAAVPFLLYNLLTDHLGTASELAGLGTGLVGGLVVARGVTREKPAIGRAAVVMAAAMVIAIGGAAPLRGLIDIRPELARIAALEVRTAGVYDEAAARFRVGRVPAAALAQLIERTILPDVQAAHARLKALRGVPTEQAPIIAAADEYCQLREASWRRRAEALRKANMKMLREADRAEQAALEAFEKIRPST